MVSGLVLMFVVYLVLLNVICFLSLAVCLCSGCDECCAFCMICDACSFRCSSVVVFLFCHVGVVSCMDPTAVLNAELCVV